MQVSDLYYKKYLKYKNKYLNLLKQIGGHSIYIEINDVVLPRETKTIDLTNAELLEDDFNLLIQYLPHFINLKNLILTNTSINLHEAPQLAIALKDKTSLETLILTSNPIDDPGAIAIAKILNTLTNLIELDLFSNSISHMGIRALANALESNTSLRILNIGNNDIFTPKTTYGLLADRLRQNTTLQTLKGIPEEYHSLFSSTLTLTI